MINTKLAYAFTLALKGDYSVREKRSILGALLLNDSSGLNEDLAFLVRFLKIQADRKGYRLNLREKDTYTVLASLAVALDRGPYLAGYAALITLDPKSRKDRNNASFFSAAMAARAQLEELEATEAERSEGARANRAKRNDKAPRGSIANDNRILKFNKYILGEAEVEKRKEAFKDFWKAVPVIYRSQKRSCERLYVADNQIAKDPLDYLKNYLKQYKLRPISAFSFLKNETNSFISQDDIVKALSRPIYPI